MDKEEKIIQRLDQLIDEAKQVEKTNKYDDLYMSNRVNNTLSNKWFMGSISFFARIFGEKSDYYLRMKENSVDNSIPSNVEMGLGILLAAKEDIEGGWLIETKTVIQADLFADFLEQAQHLINTGYKGPAAVIAGAVLEDGLRKLCDRNSIQLPKRPTIDGMNNELAKGGVYNRLKQKMITAIADIRNNAAHGKWDQFEEKDVENMIGEVEHFMAEYFK